MVFCFTPEKAYHGDMQKTFFMIFSLSAQPAIFQSQGA